MQAKNSSCVISGSGFSHPQERVTNEELVDAFNQYVDQFNQNHQAQIKQQLCQPKQHSSAEFITSVSGIQARYVRDKENLLNPQKMAAHLPKRADSDCSLQAEECVKAAKIALAQAQKTAKDIDGVIMACSHRARDYPSVSIEVQHALGIEGFAFDIGMACSSATFGISIARAMIESQTASAILVVSPEIKTGQYDPTDRDSHFIFGEASSAVIVEHYHSATAEHLYHIKDVSLRNQFSNNIRKNSSVYDGCYHQPERSRDQYFYQNGRKVFREVTQIVTQHLRQQLNKNLIQIDEIKRFWLHQANIKMNQKIVANLTKKASFGSQLSPEVLSEFGNVSSAGCILAFNKNHQELTFGDHAVLCSFGAGYAVGSLLLQKVECLGHSFA